MAVLYLSVLSLFVGFTLGDPTDWVSPDYMILQGQTSGRPASGGSDLSTAKAAVIRAAIKSGQSGPWSVVSTEKIQPPSGDVHDYLSWAPYHWPECNWCPNGKTHLVHTISGSGNDTGTPTNSFISSSSSPASTNSYNGDDPYQYFVSVPEGSDFDFHRRQAPTSTPPADLSSLPALSTLPLGETASLSQTTSAPATSDINSRTHVAQAAAKTTKASCTPSPTKSLVPSATWTTCAYVGRDGQVNSDVRSLPGPDALNSMSQACYSNAAAYAITKDALYAKKVVQLINNFYIDEATKMNPNMKFGQVVRGPGPKGIEGTFTGVLDNRGFLRVVNSVAILRMTKAPDWSAALDEGLKSWTKIYAVWLSSSAIGQMTASRPNNHGTFYKSQLAAAQYLVGSNEEAKATILDFFQKPFLDQLAVTGEQPFEAVRTRPYHYRLFNLEGLLALAKLGDYLGLDCWTMKSKYGATIQTAFDYVMNLDPKGEDKSQIYPLIPAMMAAYGDAQGTYEAFLKKNDPNYQSKVTWFNNQRGALLHAPASQSKNARAVLWSREDLPSSPTVGSTPFVCPSVFRDAEGGVVELDNGFAVTCNELEPFYRIQPPATVD
ncbi:alginate lyase-domain-containing protein [Crepidotus variabilis]|uniref:Alginate lyase-domain-containing protein n=1 Tax=Crepidotus variabilis TaxID=179855 RepID=A0A9P6ENH1_9AGAR|nr:alginate lyase-domain-containing protein [Crepidotus variabilis]